MLGPALCPILHCALDLGGHTHGAGCGHERVAHGDHEDYLVRPLLRPARWVVVSEASEPSKLVDVPPSPRT